MSGIAKKGSVQLSAKHKGLKIKLADGTLISFSDGFAFVSEKEAEELLNDHRAFEFEIKKVPVKPVGKKSAPVEDEIPQGDASDSVINDAVEGGAIAPRKPGKKNAPPKE